MHAEKVWDHDAFFAYVDRWMTEDDHDASIEIDKAFPKLGVADFSKKWFHQGYAQDFVKEMWDKYREDIPAAKDGSKTPKAAETWQ
jgi:hypothetical protein